MNLSFNRLQNKALWFFTCPKINTRKKNQILCDTTYNSEEAEYGEDKISDDEWDEDEEAKEDDDYGTDLKEN